MSDEIKKGVKFTWANNDIYNKIMDEKFEKALLDVFDGIIKELKEKESKKGEEHEA